MTELFEPAPQGPPETFKGKYAALYAWLNEHPGEWAVVRGKPNAGMYSSLRKRGLQARSITRPDGTFDIYVRNNNDNGATP